MDGYILVQEGGEEMTMLRRGSPRGSRNINSTLMNYKTNTWWRDNRWQVREGGAGAEVGVELHDWSQLELPSVRDCGRFERTNCSFRVSGVFLGSAPHTRSRSNNRNPQFLKNIHCRVDDGENILHYSKNKKNTTSLMGNYMSNRKTTFLPHSCQTER